MVVIIQIPRGIANIIQPIYLVEILIIQISDLLFLCIYTSIHIYIYTYIHLHIYTSTVGDIDMS